MVAMKPRPFGCVTIDGDPVLRFSRSILFSLPRPGGPGGETPQAKARQTYTLNAATGYGLRKGWLKIRQLIFCPFAGAGFVSARCCCRRRRQDHARSSAPSDE